MAKLCSGKHDQKLCWVRDIYTCMLEGFKMIIISIHWIVVLMLLHGLKLASNLCMLLLIVEGWSCLSYELG